MRRAITEEYIADQLASLRDALQQPDEPEEIGEIIEDGEAEPSTDESRTLSPTKIHVRGLDTMNPEEIKTYVKSHYGPVDKIEWIDDTSANLLFGSEPSARDALVSLSSIEIADPTALAIGESLPAKPVEGKPEVNLHIRFALLSDKKQPGAALRSRFYLLNPEYDPEERRRRSKYRDRDGEGRRNGRYERRHDSEERQPRFEASMYDDAPSNSKERRHSDSPDRLSSYARANQGKELFLGGRSRGSRRDRSVSPGRDADGDDSMSGERAGSLGNRVKARSIKDRLSTNDRTNKSKELFPSKASYGRGGQLDQLEDAIGSAHLREEDRPKVVADATGSFNIRGAARQQGNGEGISIKGAANAKELFPRKLGGSNAGKELLGGRDKRPSRQRAEDLFG